MVSDGLKIQETINTQSNNMIFSCKVKMKALAIQIALLCYSQCVIAGKSVEFNYAVLDAEDRDNVDLNRFSEANYILPGSYLLDVKVNNQPLPQQTITYIISPEDSKSSVACLSEDLVKSLALKEDALKKIKTINASCFDISTLPGTEINNHEGILDITIPQAWMKYSDPDWVPPERWDDGVNGLIFDYSVSGQQSKQLDYNESHGSASAYGQAGVNLGAWRFRSEYQSNFSEGNFDWTRIYGFRPLPTMAAKLTVGENYLNSQVFDSFRFIGANMASDERMLPPDLQGYAPEVRGIAKSNAKVTISQDGHVIYETTVPAGPFNIQDLRSAVRGTLDVRVEEQNGSVSTFQVNTASIPYLTRPGYIRYNTSVGQALQYQHRAEGKIFYTGDLSWGLSNAVSLYGGLFATGNEYNAWSLGIGRDLSQLGALSADVTQSLSKLPDQRAQQGMSFKLNYAKTFDELHSAITFAGYRFSQEKFRSYSQYMNERYQPSTAIGREKQMYTLTGNTTLWADEPKGSVNLFLTYTRQNYWDRSVQNHYGLSISRAFDILGVDVNANLSTYRSNYQGKNDNSVALSLSMPLGNSSWLGYDMQASSGQHTTNMVSYSNNHDDNNLWRLRAGSNSNSKAAADGYYMHRSEVADIDTSISYQQDEYVAVGGTMRGSFTATRHGMALHNGGSMDDSSRIMVGTDGVSGVPLNNKKVTTNIFGVGVVPDVISYQSFDTRIDVDAIDDDVEVAQAITTKTLTEGAIGFEHFSVAKGEKLMAVLRTKEGLSPPFGAEIHNENGVSVSMIMDNGLAYIAGVKPDEQLDVIWSGKTQCHVHVPAKINRGQDKNLLPCE